MNAMAARITVAAVMLVSAATTAVLTAQQQQQQKEHVYRTWTKAALVDAAAVHASKYDRGRRRYLRYFDLASTPPKLRARRLQALGYVVNSLSRNDEIALVPDVPGTEGALAYVDLSQLRERGDRKGVEQLIRAFDRLGELGSGPSPFPEPYYHVEADVEEVVEVTTRKEETYAVDVPYDYWNGYGYTRHYRREYRTRYVDVPTTKTKRVKKVALGPHLNKATAVGLSAVTETAFPIFYLDWFMYNALTEPRYHELLGLGEDESTYLELAAADQRLADRRGSNVRGAVLFSEVAHHNRILERTPTILYYGKAVYAKSYDYKSSIRVQDVLSDLLNPKADAFEVIASLPNGLLFFGVFDGEKKRLDKADGDVANNRRSRFKDTQVRTAYHCIACHLPDRGWIDVDDEVRALAAKPITLYIDTLKDERRGDRIRQQYLKADMNTLLDADRAVVEAATEAATRAGFRRGLTCPETAKALTDTIYLYLEQPVALSQLAAELGYPQDEVLAACQTAGVDAAFVGVRSARRARRDQIAAGFVRIATILHQGK